MVGVGPAKGRLNMNKASGGGLLVAGIVIILLGLILRLGIIQWLIDFTGIILIILGIVLIVVGVLQMITGRGDRI